MKDEGQELTDKALAVLLKDITAAARWFRISRILIRAMQ